MKHSLILVDIQKEYFTKDRSFYLNNHEKSLSNCAKILTHARLYGWEIVHIQHFNKNPKSDRFQQGSEYADFASGFEPLSKEHVFIKHDYSCFSSPRFAGWIHQKTDQNERIYLIGYSTAFCLNSTFEEAHRRGIHLILVEDASLAKSVPGFSEEQIHNMLIAIWKDKGIGKICSTKDLLVER